MYENEGKNMLFCTETFSFGIHKIVVFERMKENVKFVEKFKNI